jgi:hypothetical protein
MASTRNTILNAFKAVIDGMDAGAFGQPEAIIGVRRVNDLSGKPRAEVWFHSDHGSHVDSYSEQVIRVVTKVKFKFDDSAKTTKGDTALLQASEMYDAIHAAIETAYNDASTPDTPFYNLGTGYLTITQEEPGIQPYGFDDGDEYMGIGEVWRVKYKRTEGGT